MGTRHHTGKAALFMTSVLATISVVMVDPVPSAHYST